jgi:hypothetical protein
MKRMARIGIGLAALGCATGAAAQSFNQAIARYRAGKAECAEAYRARIGHRCDPACRAAAGARQDKCLAEVERRYRAAIGRELRRPRG